MTLLGELFDGAGIHGSRRVAAGAESLVGTLPEFVQQHLGEDAAGRVSRAQEQDITHSNASQLLLQWETPVPDHRHSE